MNKIIILGYDDNPEIEFEKIFPFPDPNHIGGQNYTFTGIKQKSHSLIRHIIGAKIKFDCNILFEEKIYHGESCYIQPFNPFYPDSLELEIASLD